MLFDKDFERFRNQIHKQSERDGSYKPDTSIMTQHTPVKNRKIPVIKQLIIKNTTINHFNNCSCNNLLCGGYTNRTKK